MVSWFGEGEGTILLLADKAISEKIQHDLRHTFNTNMRKAGVSESVIMAITGHSTREMFDRYNTIDEEDVKKAVDQLEGFLAVVDHFVEQDEKKAT